MSEARGAQIGVGWTEYRATEYLRFFEGVSASGRTKDIMIYSARRVELLGRIAWFGRWRQYAFYPMTATVWNHQCMWEVMEEVAKLNAGWQEIQAAKRKASA